MAASPVGLGLYGVGWALSFTGGKIFVYGER